MEVEQAIQLAVSTVSKLFAGQGHRLEEVELRDNGDFEITVSFHDPKTAAFQPYTFGTSGISTAISGFRRAAIGVDASRTYKDVVIDSQGKVKAIRMRQIVVG